jgi:hypothetical protein
VCVGSSSAAPSDYQCSEYSSYASENDFIFIVSDSSNGQQARIQADASAADLFNPVASRSQLVNGFTGIVSYFSGGSEFTLNARCDDDIAVVPPPGQPCPTGQTCSPLSSNQACVHARTQSAINANTP